MTGPTKHIAGIVLCGGQSSRMGREKWALPWGNETLLQRTVRILSEVMHPIVVVAAAEQNVSGLPADAILVRDRISAQGPLGGLHAGLQELAQVNGPRIEAAYVTACDTPLLKPEFVRAIIERLETHELAVAKEGRFHHPLAGIYRLSLIDRIEKLLRASRNRPLFLIEDSDSCEVDVEELRSVDPELDSLRNCNTPEEYEAVLKKIQPSLLSDSTTGKHHSS